MSDFDINVCGSYTDMVLSILDQFWRDEAIAVDEDSRVLPGGIRVRVFEDHFPTAEPIKSGVPTKLAETINNTLRSLGFAPLDEPSPAMRYRCPSSRNCVAVYITEEGVIGKETAA